MSSTHVLERPASGRIRVLVADDSALARRALALQLAAHDELHICGMAEDGGAALGLCRSLRPDVLVLDLSMPHMDGMAVLAAVRRECPDTQVVILSGYRAAEYAPAALSGGAAAYVEKGADAEHLARTILGAVAPPDATIARSIVTADVDADVARDLPRHLIEQVPATRAPAVPRRRRSARQAALERAQNDCAAALAALQELAEATAARLGEPLALLADEVELLARDGEGLSATQQQAVARMRADADYACRLLADLRAFALAGEPSRLRLAAVPLEDCLLRAIAALSEQLRASAGRIERMSALPTVVADPAQIERLLRSLLANAISFRRAGTPPAITIDATLRQHDVVISIADNGVGIAAADVDAVLAPFTRLQPAALHGGSGMGLPIARRIAEAHGGGLCIVPHDGRGTTVQVTLPVDGPTWAAGSGR